MTKKLAGSNNGNWKGGRGIVGKGYVAVATGTGNRVYEHVLVAERSLGKSLPVKAVVHHIDENKKNNENGNLVICQDEKYHKLIHRRMKALRESGDATKRHCKFCQKWDLPLHLKIVSCGPISEQSYHKACAAEQARRYRASKKRQDKAA